jgi:hypothetical protein
MRAILFTLMSVLSAAAFSATSATVYKWVDENGVTHYSDQPHENAEKVQLAQPQTYKAPRAPQGQQPAANAAASNSQSPSRAYNGCPVVQPANEDTFPNATSVSTTVVIDPHLQQGDQVILMLDGARLQNFPVGGGSYTITPIERGTHTLQALIQDGGGNVVCQSASVSFSVVQPSVLNPANPNFHH